MLSFPGGSPRVRIFKDIHAADYYGWVVGLMGFFSSPFLGVGGGEVHFLFQPALETHSPPPPSFPVPLPATHARAVGCVFEEKAHEWKQPPPPGVLGCLARVCEEMERFFAADSRGNADRACKEVEDLPTLV